MTTALLASRKGLSIQIIEKDKELGGHLKPEYLPLFKKDYIRYVQYLINSLKKENVSILTNTAFSNDLLNSVPKPDYIFNTSGSEFKKLKFDGLKADLEMHPMDAYRDVSYEGKYLVVGGGLVGSEAALNIAMHGGDVTIVEIDKVIAKSSFKANREHLLFLLKTNNVKIFTKSRINKIVENIAYITNSGNDKTEENEIIFDRIIGCVGLIPNIINNISIKRFNIPPIINIGDSVKPGTVLDAIWGAWRKTRLLL
jgi:2-enoate reductase